MTNASVNRCIAWEHSLTLNSVAACLSRWRSFSGCDRELPSCGGSRLRAPHALWASTAILGLSSWILELAREALRERHWFAYRRRLLLTVYLGLAFIACQGAALWQLIRQGMYLQGNPHAAVFYVFTGAHGFHLACGMVGLNYLLFRRGRDWSQHRALSGSLAIYWHFMGVLWLGLFLLLLVW